MRSEDRVATGVDADPTPNPVAPTPLEGRRRLRAAFAAVPRRHGAWRGRLTEEARVPWLGLGLGCAIPNPEPNLTLTLTLTLTLILPLPLSLPLSLPLPLPLTLTLTRRRVSPALPRCEKMRLCSDRAPSAMG